MADWQSIPSDPCTQLSPFHHPELAVNYSSAVNDSTPRPPTYNDYDLITVANTDPVNFDCYKQQNCVIVYENVTHSQEFQIFPDAIYAIAMNKCESATIPNHHCYWIPNSIVTNRHCGDCPLICRDKKRSLNFVQFLLGATLLMGSTPFCRVPILGFISDRVPRKIQVSQVLSLNIYLNLEFVNFITGINDWHCCSFPNSCFEYQFTVA